MVTNQGEEAQKLSEERRSRWISAISRDDLTEEILENDRVCEKHFVSGRAAKSWDKFNIDWVPTLLLGHKKATEIASLMKSECSKAEPLFLRWTGGGVVMKGILYPSEIISKINLGAPMKRQNSMDAFNLPLTE